jgi:hypothetical protein
MRNRAPNASTGTVKPTDITATEGTPASAASSTPASAAAAADAARSRCRSSAVALSSNLSTRRPCLALLACASNKPLDTTGEQWVQTRE